MSADLAAALAADGIAQAVLIEAVAGGRFGMLGIDGPDDRLTAATLETLGEPQLVVLAANHGPGRVRCSVILRSWAQFAVLHAIAERATDYAVVAHLTELHDRVLLVETTAPLAQTWLAFLRGGPPLMGLLPGWVRS